MNVQRTPDRPVKDDLDVAGALIELGINDADLDRELAIAESTGTSLLNELLDPTPGLEQRIEAKVAQRLRDREAAWTLADLTGLGWATLKAMIDNQVIDTEPRSSHDR